MPEDITKSGQDVTPEPTEPAAAEATANEAAVPAEAEADPIKVASAPTESTPGGQEAEEATPETAPAAETETDPAVEQKVASFEAEDVATLVEHASSLVTEVGRLRKENGDLQAELVALKGQYGQLATEVTAARQVVSKALDLPLRPQAQGHLSKADQSLSGLAEQFPFLDAKVASYIHRTTGDRSES
jgi:chemotaxis protein histidine kinase CheA